MAPQSCRATECVSLYFSDWYAAPYCYNPECSPQYIFISTSMSKIGQAKPKCQPLFQGVTKFRPHLCIQWLKMVPRQHFWAEAESAVYFHLLHFQSLCNVISAQFAFSLTFVKSSCSFLLFSALAISNINAQLCTCF